MGRMTDLTTISKGLISGIVESARQEHGGRVAASLEFGDGFVRAQDFKGYRMILAVPHGQFIVWQSVEIDQRELPEPDNPAAIEGLIYAFVSNALCEMNDRMANMDAIPVPKDLILLYNQSERQD